MSTAEHIYEPGLHCAAPRKVRVRAGLAALLAASIVLVAMLIVFGSASLFEAVRLIWLSRTGTTVTATVTALYYDGRRELVFDAARAQQISAFEYRFSTPAGRVVVARTQIELSRTMVDQSAAFGLSPPGQSKPAVKPAAPKLRYLPGTPVLVRYATFGSRVFCRPWERSPAGHIAFLLMSGMSLVGIAVVIGLRIYRRILSGYRLARNGLISVGVIVSKDAVSEDTMRYYVTFAALPSRNNAKSTDKNRVWTRPCSQQQFLHFAPDQHVTLIAPPGNPDETTLFRLLPFGR